MEYFPVGTHIYHGERFVALNTDSLVGDADAAETSVDLGTVFL